MRRTTVSLWGLMCLALPAALVAAADWPQLGNNPQHTGYSPESLRPPLKRKWITCFPPERLYPAIQPVVAQGKLFIGTENGNFYCLNAKTGRKLWKFPAAADEQIGAIMHTAGVQGDRVFVAAMDGCVYALHCDDGAMAWKFDAKTRTGFSSAVLLAEGKVFVPNRGGAMFAIDQAGGNVAWQTSLDCGLFQSPAYNEGRVYVVGMDMRLRALDAATGKLLWTTEPMGGWAVKDFWPVVYRGMVIIRPMTLWEHRSGPKTSRVTFIYDEKTGEPLDFDLPSGITMNGAVAPPCVSGDGQLVTTAGGGWATVNVETGQVTVISNETGGKGNQDENMTPVACQNLIFALHIQEGNANFTGFYEPATKKWLPLGGNSAPIMVSVGGGGTTANFYNNTQGGGSGQGVVADGVLYHVTYHRLGCWEGAE